MSKNLHDRLNNGNSKIGTGVAAIILNNNKQIFLAKRSMISKNEAGKWEIPGGKIESDEIPEDALRREIMEEIGVEIEIIRLFRTGKHEIKARNECWIFSVYLCKIKSGKPQIMEPTKCAEIGWFNLNEAMKLSLSSITLNDLEIYVNQIES